MVSRKVKDQEGEQEPGQTPPTKLGSRLCAICWVLLIVVGVQS